MKSIRQAGKFIFTGALLFAMVPSAFATTYNWATNGSGYWTNAANWSPVGVPTSGDTATLPQSFSSAITITLDGGNRSLNDVVIRGSSGTAKNLLINLNNGASLTTPFTSRDNGGIIVSNGTLIGTGGSGLGAGETAGTMTLNGGNVYMTNGAQFSVRNGRSVDSVLQVNAGTFTFNDSTVGFSMNVGELVGSGVFTGKGIMNVAGGTVNVMGAADAMKIGNWSANRTATAVVNVTSGTLNTFVGSSGKRLIVGARAPGNSAFPDSAFATNMAQLSLSGTGTLNADGWGVWVGRNGNPGDSDFSPGEFSVFDGIANLGGTIVGNQGKLFQSGGIVRYTARNGFINEATNSAQHLFMTGGLTLFQGIYSNKMTIAMGGATAGNVLGDGFYNVHFGGNDMSPFQITLPNEFYGRGTASGGNGYYGDGIMDLTVWTNTTVIWNSTTYSGTNGPNSLYAFGSVAETWGWDFFVAVPEPSALTFLVGAGLTLLTLRRRA